MPKSIERKLNDQGGARKRLIVKAIKDASGLPSIILLSSMTGFGSLAQESGFSLPQALAITLGVWGLPGQVALAELYAAGSEVIAILMAVSMANARFMPMAVSLMPLLREGMTRPAWLYALVQMMSINTWAAAMRQSGRLEPPHRRLYFVVFASVCVTAALTGTVAGFAATTTLDRPVALGLIFLSPLFFALLLSVSKDRAIALSLVVGAVCGPALHLLSEDWGVLLAGIIAGSIAFALSRTLRPMGGR